MTVQRRVSDTLLFLVVTGAVFLTRLPFLGPGLGADADAWRVYLAGRTIALTGAYTASRLPGYPVIEYSTALAWPYGYTALNALTALMSAVAVAFFALTLRRLGARTWWAGAAALALVPVMFVNSVVLMDYAWALAFMLGALYFTTAQRPGLGGAFLGLAVGCRLTSAIALLPLGLMVLVGLGNADATSSSGSSRATRLRHAAILAGTALVVAVLLYSPVIARFGPSFLAFVESDVPPRAALERFRSASGDLGLAAIILALMSIPLAVLTRRRFQPRPVLARGHRALALVWGLGVFLYLVAYVRLPLESGYLLPVVPFALLLGAAVLDERVWLGACALLALAWAVSLSGGGAPSGPLLRAQRARVARYSTAKNALEKARDLGPGAVILAGSSFPAIQAMELDGPPTSARFLYEPDPTELSRLIDRGHAVYYLEGVDDLMRERYRTDLSAMGARPLGE